MDLKKICAVLYSNSSLTTILFWRDVHDKIDME